MDVGTILKSLSEGFGYSLLIFIGTLILALPLGLLISFGAMSRIKPLKYLTKGFIWVIRGTPLMLQIIIIFYVPAMLNIDIITGMFGSVPNGVQWSRVTYTIIAFTINYACYFAEIYRGGISSISKGQYEGARLLGLTGPQTFKFVIFPQVYKRIIAPMSNEIITLVKDTSLARIIAVSEIVLVANNIISREGIVWPIFAAGVFYLAFNGLLTLIFNRMEKKVAYYN